MRTQKRHTVRQGMGLPASDAPSESPGAPMDTDRPEPTSRWGRLAGVEAPERRRETSMGCGLDSCSCGLDNACLCACWGCTQDNARKRSHARPTAVALRASRVPAVTRSQWNKLETALRAGPRAYTLDQLVSLMGIERTLAFGVMIATATEGLADNEWLVFHCKEEPVAFRPFSQGFQPSPWTCPGCKVRIIDPDALRYDMRCTIQGPLTIK
jgi:hypothetical protein